jgi:hypothetical protein
MGQNAKYFATSNPMKDNHLEAAGCPDIHKVLRL